MKLYDQHHVTISQITALLEPSECEDFMNFVKKVTRLEAAALVAAETLDEVRTGEDFECVCADKARDVRRALGIKGEFDDE